MLLTLKFYFKNKNIMKRKMIFVALLALSVSFGAEAGNMPKNGETTDIATYSQIAKHKNKHKKRKGKLQKEIKAYMEKNVMPVLKEHRAKLDAKIKTEDQQKLAELRKKLEALKEQRKDFRKEYGKAMKSNELTAEQLLKMQTMRKETKNAMKTSREMAKAYEKEITEVTAPLEKQREQWKQDIMAIVQKHWQERLKDKQKDVPSEKDEKKPKENEKEELGGKRGAMPRGLRGMKPVAFLLLDTKK
jgi:chromosome segregation ATPase